MPYDAETDYGWIEPAATPVSGARPAPFPIRCFRENRGRRWRSVLARGTQPLATLPVKDAAWLTEIELGPSV
jgi:hypothetical protein